MKTFNLILAALALFSPSAFASHKYITRVTCTEGLGTPSAPATSLQLDISAHRSASRPTTIDFNVRGYLKGQGSLSGSVAVSEREFARLERQGNMTVTPDLMLFNGEGYNSINRYQGRLIALKGAGNRISALAVNMDHAQVSGEKPVQGPRFLQLYLTNCEVQ